MIKYINKNGTVGLVNKKVLEESGITAPYLTYTTIDNTVCLVPATESEDIKILKNKTFMIPASVIKEVNATEVVTLLPKNGRIEIYKGVVEEISEI